MSKQTEQTMDEVLARLQGIWASPIEVKRFEFELKRLEHAIRGYRRKDPVRSYYLLGLVATLREDCEGMRGYFKNALFHSGNDADVRHGFGACLARLGFFSEAREQYEILFRHDNKDLNLLAELIVTSLAAGRIQDGVRWIQRWSELNPERPFEEADSIARSGKLLERFGISDDHVERLQALALGILERERKVVRTINYQGVPLDDPKWIRADLVLDESEDVVEDLNGKLTNAMTRTATPRRVADVLVFGYLSKTKSVS